MFAALATWTFDHLGEVAQPQGALSPLMEDYFRETPSTVLDDDTSET
jgi:hypothetical protein